MQLITRKPLFWLFFTVTSLVCIGFSYHYFSTAFPIVNLSLDMNRSDALSKSTQLAAQLPVGPSEFTQAASFDVDSDVQTFVELEAGGKEAFAQMIKDPYYAPYQWTVRHFKECEKQEAYFKFKPDGTPYGMIEILSENFSGAALNITQAQTIAEQNATAAPWNIQLTDYTLVESSKEVRPSGRIDHLFTYERTGKTIGKGFYRLRLGVSGDKVTEITHSVKIPEEFTLRYQEMRSTNNSIAAGAGMAYLLLYILGGCILGLFFLLRRNWILWKQALLWALIIAGLHVLVNINQLPLSWMQYHTALSMQGFILKYCMMILYQFLYMAIFYGLIFIAAESLTRAAFSYQPQLWKVWNNQAASSMAIAGRTIGGYLLVPICLAFIISFYIFTSGHLGWWSPSAALIDPNILATYFPWLSCLVLSLGAGFMEECLFRAIPISCAALIGKRLGNQRLWLVAGFIIQALIFGAAHANYAAQPAYARVVELLFFSTLNGLVFLWFGLLPAIITHFTYDVVLMSLPLFVSTASGAWLNQGIVILCTLIPLFIVIRARLKYGTWISLSQQYLNGSWTAPIHAQKETIEAESPETKTFSTIRKKIIIGAGALGIILVATTADFDQDANRIAINQSQALDHAKKILETKNISTESWTLLPMVADDEKGSQEKQLPYTFIWQQECHELYHQLLGNYLNPARWYVRFVTWNGSVSDRAEEHVVSLIADGQLYRYYHKLPENKPGQSLDESQARMIAHAGLKSAFGLNAAEIQEISAVATKHPERKDWTFTFANNTAHKLKQGQLRNVIEIAGGEIVGSYGYVHVPEEWEREHLNKQNMIKIISFLCMLFLYLMIIMGMFYAVMRNKRMLLISHSTAFFCIALGLLGVFKLANALPSFIATFNTSEPFSHQLFSYIGLSVIGILFRAGAFGIILAILTSWQKPYLVSDKKPWIYGISIGICVSGFAAILQTLNRTYEPLWADYSSLGTYLPILDSMAEAATVFITLTALFMILSIIMDSLAIYWRKRPVILVVLHLILGIIMAGRLMPETLSLWLISGAILGGLLLAIYLTIGHYSNQALVWTAATITGFYYLQQAIFNAYPHAIAGNLLAILVVFGLAYAWSRKIK